MEKIFNLLIHVKEYEIVFILKFDLHPEPTTYDSEINNKRIPNNNVDWL